MEIQKTPKYKIGDKVKTSLGCEHIIGDIKGVITNIFQGWNDNYYYKINNNNVFYPEKTLEKTREIGGKNENKR